MDTANTVLSDGTPRAAIVGIFNRFRAELGLGRLHAARAVLDTLFGTNQSAALAAIQFAVTGLVPPTVGQGVLGLLEDPPQRATTVYWRTIAALAGGDTATARSLLDSPLAADSATHPNVPDSFFHALNAWTRVEVGDTTGGLPELQRSLLEAGYTSGAQIVLRPVFIALARTEAARPESRTKGINWMKQLMDLDPLGEIALNVPLAEALEAEGRTAEAAEAYNRFISLWASADPELQPRVDAARRALARITAERPGG